MEKIVSMSERDHRQHDVLAWVRRTFGEPTLTIEERITRFAEEAIELAQAAGMSRDRVLALVDMVVSKDIILELLRRHDAERAT